MSTNYLKNFAEGETILASETNANNQFLLSKISENAGDLQTTVNSQISNIKSEVATTKLSLQTEIDKKLNASEKQAIILWGIPDYKKGRSVGASFTAPSHGVYTATLNYNNNTAYFNINGVNAYCYVDGDGVNGAVNTPFTVPLAKGDVCSWSANVEVKFARFFPMRGAE